MCRLLTFCLILSFLSLTHCGENQSSSELSQKNQVEKTFVANLQAAQTITLNPHQEPLRLNLEKGQIVDSKQKSNSCLKKEKLNAIKELFKEDSLCELGTDLPEDIMCAMVYTFPYLAVEFSNSSEAVLLGEAANSCRINTIDLCDHSESLLKIINSIDLKNDFSDCP